MCICLLPSLFDTHFCRFSESQQQDAPSRGVNLCGLTQASQAAVQDVPQLHPSGVGTRMVMVQEWAPASCPSNHGQGIFPDM